MTGRQEYDRTKDRQRILGKYMIDTVYTMYEIRYFLIDISSASYTVTFLLIRIHVIYHVPLSSVMITIRRSITIFLEESPSQPHLTRGRAYLLEAVTM
jgi:hypothetical protein